MHNLRLTHRSFLFADNAAIASSDLIFCFVFQKFKVSLNFTKKEGNSNFFLLNGSVREPNMSRHMKTAEIFFTDDGIIASADLNYLNNKICLISLAIHVGYEGGDIADVLSISTSVL